MGPYDQKTSGFKNKTVSQGFLTFHTVSSLCYFNGKMYKHSLGGNTNIAQGLNITQVQQNNFTLHDSVEYNYI